MKKQHFWFILCLFTITGFFNACENGCNGTGTNGPANNSSDEEFVIDGHIYIHHIKNDGSKAQPTEYVEYYYSMSADDSLLTDSRDLNLLSNMQIPPAEQKSSRPQPILKGLSLMSPGDSMTVKIPMDSLPQIPIGFSRYNFLIYRLAMVDIKNQAEKLAENQEKAKKMQAQREVDMAREESIKKSLLKTLQDYKSGKLDGQMKTTTSGLKYIIHEKGTGRMPKNLNPLKAHYYAMLEDGTPFENSFNGGNPYFFTLGAKQVYRGWDEGMALMPIGSKATFLLSPSLLIFGEDKINPNIPEGSSMIFYIETLYPY